MVALAKEEFYNLLCADVTKLCTRITAKPVGIPLFLKEFFASHFPIGDQEGAKSSDVRSDVSYE